MQSSTFDLQLAKLAYGGAALGRSPGGRAVFVPFALPGEKVRVRVVEEKRGHIRAELIALLEASPQRIAPRCKHCFSPLSALAGGGEGMGPVLSEVEGVRAACGGCHYQHIPYEMQLTAKAEILRDQLTRIGKIKNPPVKPIAPSPSEWNYRNHVQFHLTAEGKLGYVRSGDGLGPSRSLLTISECHLPEPPLDTLWPGLEFEPDSGIQRVSLRLGADEEVMLVLESDDPIPPELEIEADISVVHLYEDNAVVLAGEDHIFINVRDRPFRVSAASFFQVNTSMAVKIVEHLLVNLPISSTTTLLDVYCGVGLFSAFFAPRLGQVIGIESSPSACADFVVNLDEFDNVELYEGLAEDILPHLNVKPDIVLVDPPRSGLDKRVVDALLAQGPRTLAYVSCDPSTLARDAAQLIAGGFSLKQVTPFDLFPQTYHIESISIFQKT